MKNKIIAGLAMLAIVGSAEIDFSKADAMRREREWQSRGHRSYPVKGVEEREYFVKEREGVIQAACQDFAAFMMLKEQSRTNEIAQIAAAQFLKRYQIATNLLVQAKEDPATTRKMRNFNGRRYADEQDNIRMLTIRTSEEADATELRRRERWSRPLTEFP